VAVRAGEGASVWDAAGLATLTHGTSGLLLGYAAVELPLLAGLRRERAPASKWLLSPLAAVPATLAAGIGMSVIGSSLQAIGFGEALTSVVGVGVFAGVGYISGRAYARYAPASDSVTHQRGAVVLDSPPGSRASAREATSSDQGRENSITLAGVPIPLRDETKHFKIIGTTGTGKSTAIRELLGGALARGDRAIIADPDAGYLERFYDPKRGDVILNPFEKRSVKWDLFGEIQTPYDVAQLARSLIPDQGGSDRSWTGYARTFFTAVTRQAHAQGVRDLGELYNLLVVAPPEELRGLVKGTPAQPFLDEQNGRMFDSIRSVTSSAVGALEYVAGQNAPGFSIRQWVREGAQRRADHALRGGEGRPEGGVLFIPYRAGQIAALRSSISAWMRLGIFEAMDQPQGDQRLWFVLDELDALGPIDGLNDAMTRLRKYGGRGILGFQSISQVSGNYGRDAQSIVENAGNSLILRSSGSENGGTAQFASRLIGQREVLRTTISRSRRATEFFGTTSRSEHLALEYAVLPSEIEQLPDLEGYLRIAAAPHWQRARLSLEKFAEPGPAPAAAPTPAPLAEVARADAVRQWQRDRSPSARDLPGASPGGSKSNPEFDR